MRLLRFENGDFSLAEFNGRASSQYAILSHTWGPDYEEVTFKDLMECTGKNKAGYRKLTFCANQVVQDSLQYFWIDTCCIDKSSSAELSEAINSMFRWYQDAARCYVYLSDVSFDGPVKDISSTWKLAFESSRWFTRGWTLQELLAPKSVQFFSREERSLGNKRSLERSISETTRIPVTALQGSPLSSFSVEERISWAAKRQTKREEDAAYALLGIFDVHMSLIYGEGQQKAFGRLRNEIEKPLDSLTEHVHWQTKKLNNLDTKFQQIRRQMKNRPKALGFPWESGAPEDQLKVDDGLGAEYLLPVKLCETPEVIAPFLLR